MDAHKAKRRGGSLGAGSRRSSARVTRRLVLAAPARLAVLIGTPLLAASCARATPSGSSAPAAGGPSAGPARGKITWLVRSQQIENDWEQQVVLPAMRQQYPQLEIDLQIAPPDVAWNEKVFSLYAAGTPPDVHNGIVGTFIQLYAQGKLVELTPLAARDRFDLKAFGGYERDQDMCRSGKQWSLPILTTLGTMTFYNLDLLEQAGISPPPRSWTDRSWNFDRVIDIGRKTTRSWGQPDAIYGLLPYYSGIGMHAWAYLWDGDPFPKEFYTQGIARESTWTSPAVVEAMQFYQDLALKQQIMPRKGAPTRAFREGGAALWGTTGWNVSDLREVTLFRWGIAPLPWKVTNRTLSYTDPVVISKETKALDASWALVKYLTGREGQLAYSKATGRPPTRTDAFDPWLDQTLKLPGMALKSRDQLLEVVTGYLKNHVDNWAHYVVNAGPLQDVERDVDNKLLSGEAAPAPAMQDMKARMDAVLRETYEQFKSSLLVRDTPCT